MNPGKIDRRIIMQKRSYTKDETGSRVESCSDESKVWAEYVSARGGEGLVADADRGESSQQFRIRFRSDLIGPHATSDFRILYKSRIYDIKGISQEGGRSNTILLDTLNTQSVS